MRLPLIAVVLAASVIPQSIEQLTDRADFVIRAHVTEQAVSRRGDRQIVTVTGLRVDECLKGSCPRSLEVQQTGGTIGRESVVLPGDAHLLNGEEVLVFLRCGGASVALTCSLVGLSLGKFHLAAEGTSWRATRDTSELAIVGGSQPDVSSAQYDDLAARIRARAKQDP